MNVIYKIPFVPLLSLHPLYVYLSIPPIFLLQPHRLAKRSLITYFCSKAGSRDEPFQPFPAR